MSSHAGQVLRRLGLIAPIQPSAAMLLGVMIAICYIRQITFSGGSIMAYDTLTLVRLGALPLVARLEAVSGAPTAAAVGT